jgi:hypothetical protein
VVEYGDEWMPIMMRSSDRGAKIADLQRMAKEAGRGPIGVSVFGVPPRREFVEQLEGEGVTRVIFGLPPAEADTVLPLLKRATEAMKA